MSPKLTEAWSWSTNWQVSSETKIWQQWEAEMETMNTKYNLDCFSGSELDSESNKGEQYHYEHGYETLIWKVPKHWNYQDKILQWHYF